MESTIKKSIVKLNNIVIKLYLIYLYYNVSLLKKVFFGCRIINLEEEQGNLLRKMYKIVIAKKLGLGSNFPRVVLYSRKIPQD